jgi:hypothetical protein
MDTQPEGLDGSRFTAAGSVSMSERDFAELPYRLWRTKDSPTTPEALEAHLKAEGWVLSREGGSVTLSAGGSGLFSGRWDDARRTMLVEMARVGFEGALTVEGEGDGADYEMKGGDLTVRGFGFEMHDPEGTRTYAGEVVLKGP